ncbi:MAG TPA: hypothetical protein VMP12_00765 [Candidatus Sulfotelmatobacter sp.]|nr:hypothetical protein [Candidatus Sulfotelmatobacter sp.]
MSKTFVTKTTEIQLGDRKVALSPLTLLELQQVQENSAKLSESGASWIEYVNGTAPFIQASMKRASGLDEDPRVFLDLESWRVLWDELLEISGLKVAAEGESKPATA